MPGKVALLTNATQYAGPGTADALARDGWEMFCHDDSFVSAEPRASYEEANPGRIASCAQSSASFVSEAIDRFGRIDALISNDIPKGVRLALDDPEAPSAGPSEADLFSNYDAMIDSLLHEPVRLLRAALPTMQAAKQGSIVMITSGGPLRNPPMMGSHPYNIARSGVHAMVKSLAVELAPLNIQLNAVAPLLVYSETFFPSPLGADDPRFASYVNDVVPMRRFGRQEEIGALVASLVSGTMTFVSGQVISFSGGGS